MKNIDIINLAGSGIFSISANTLDAAHAYKVIKFKSAVRKAAQAIDESQKTLTTEAGIDDPQAFDKEYQDLLKSKSNPERLKELDGKFKRLVGLRGNLYNEEANLEGVKTIPYEQFFALQKENKDIKEKPLENFADLLEGILWTGEPEESKAE